MKEENTLTRIPAPRIAVNVFTAIMPFAAWFMMFEGPGGVLSSRGMESLKYFTILSNLLEGFASLGWLLALRASRRVRHFAEVIKFIACICVFLTFDTVMVFLGPMFGYASMFAGPNLWLHLVIPLAALFEVLFLMREPVSVREAASGVFPIVVYGCFYIGNILINGRGDERRRNDFYGFVTWGIPAGVLIFAFIIAVMLGAAMLLRKAVLKRALTEMAH